GGAAVRGAAPARLPVSPQARARSCGRRGPDSARSVGAAAEVHRRRAQDRGPPIWIPRSPPAVELPPQLLRPPGAPRPDPRRPRLGLDRATASPEATQGCQRQRARLEGPGGWLLGARKRTVQAVRGGDRYRGRARGRRSVTLIRSWARTHAGGSTLLGR